MRLAEEYVDARDRGEVAASGQRAPKKTLATTTPFRCGSGVKFEDRAPYGPPERLTAADLGLRRDEIHEAHKLFFK